MKDKVTIGGFGFTVTAEGKLAVGGTLLLGVIIIVFVLLTFWPEIFTKFVQK